MTTMQSQIEVNQKEFIVTHGWLVEMGAYDNLLAAFNEMYPIGSGPISELLETCVELEYFNFAEWIVDNAPINKNVMVLDHLNDQPFYNGGKHIYYNGDLNIIGNAYTLDNIYIKGNLKIGKNLYVSDCGYISAKQVNSANIVLIQQAKVEGKEKVISNSINTNNFSEIIGNTVANSIKMQHNSEINGNVLAYDVELKYACIFGDVDAYNVSNNRGLITGNVNTVKINNINGGKVDGIITYKSLSH